MGQYWLDLFTPESWAEFRDAGSNVSGFRESRASIVRKLQPGDRLLCYATRVSRFVGVLEVLSEAYTDETPIWKDDVFPLRVRVKPLLALDLDVAVPVYSMRERLSMFQQRGDQPIGMSWTGHFRASPAKWKLQDGVAVEEALHDALLNPVIRAIEPGRLRKTPQALPTSIGPVTVPEPDKLAESETLEEGPTPHTDIQGTLLRLGSEMGFEVWVAKNDRSRTYKGQKLGEMPRALSKLPLQFDPATLKTVELIDVLWLKGNAVIAAFEVESTTSIYSGLLRMSDLLAMQPNINIPLYLVAPDDRREKVFMEVNRPTFSKLSPQLSDVCRYISFSSFQHRMNELSGVLRFLKPEILEELSESCAVDEIG